MIRINTKVFNPKALRDLSKVNNMGDAFGIESARNANASHYILQVMDAYEWTFDQIEVFTSILKILQGGKV